MTSSDVQNVQVEIYEKREMLIDLRTALHQGVFLEKINKIEEHLTHKIEKFLSVG